MVARIEFADLMGRKFTIPGRWTESTPPTQAPPPRKAIDGLEPVTIEIGRYRELDIAVKAEHGDAFCYAFNDASLSFPNGENPDYKLGGEVLVTVQLVGENIDQKIQLTIMPKIQLGEVWLQHGLVDSPFTMYRPRGTFLSGPGRPPAKPTATQGEPPGFIFTCESVPLLREIHSDHLPVERSRHVKFGYGKGHFATLRVRINRPATRRVLITALVTYCDTDWKPLFPSLDGAWLFPDYAGAAGRLGGMHSSHKISLDGQESAYLGIALQYDPQMKDGCFALSTNSRSWTGWENPELLLMGPTVHVRIEILGAGTKEVFRYILRNIGEDRPTLDLAE